MDMGTGIALFGAAKLGEKLLGPTADYLGAGIKEWTERRVVNVRNIFGNAIHRLGGQIDVPGVIPPRVLRGILTDGPYCEDKLTAEYLGGILASSRSSIDRDGRGAAQISAVGRLSAYQVRGHYLVYSALCELLKGSQANLGIHTVRNDARMFIPYSAFKESMDYQPNENHGLITSHVVVGLIREQLIDSEFAITPSVPSDDTSPFWKTAGPGIIVGPSLAGIELFLWGLGLRDTAIGQVLNGQEERTMIEGVRLIRNAALLNRLPEHGSAWDIKS